jgi:choline-sulfatase
MIHSAGACGIPLPLTQTEICVSETTKWLQEHVALHREQPFLLSVNFDKPHFPFKAPVKYLRHYQDQTTPFECSDEYIANSVPFVRRAAETFGCGWGKDDQTKALEGYCACIEWVDDAIGRILDSLEYLGLREDTVIVYASDHGELAGQYGSWNKTLFFDASSKVPLIFNWPGRIPVGQRDHLTGLIDLFPTFCDLADVESPDDCDGESLTSSFSGESDMCQRMIFSESAFLGAPAHAGCMIRKDNWKYNYYLDGAEELYDMENDSLEVRNVAGDKKLANIKRELKKILVQFWMPECHSQRISHTNKAMRHKHCYEFSNQFVSKDGTMFDARP